MATLGGTQFIGSATAIEENQGIVFLVINSYSKDPHHRLLWTDTALRAYTKTFHNHLFFGVVPLPDVESFEEVFEKLPEFARQVEASHYQYVALAFVGHGKQVDGFDCLLTNNHLRPTRISVIIAEFEKAFNHKIKLFFFDMCRESNHPDPSRILLGPHLQLPQNSYVVFSTQCDSKAWDYAYQPGSHKYSVWSEHFNELISTVVGASLTQVIASVNRRLRSINQRAEVIDYGDIGKYVLLPERDGREFTKEDKVALEVYKSFMNVVRLGHGSTSIIVHDLLQPFYNNVLEIIREILEVQLRADGLLHVQQFLQQYVNFSGDVIVEAIHTIFKRHSAGFFCYDLNLFKHFVQEFPNPKLQAALSALETVQSEIHSDSHTPYHFAKVEFQVAYHTFEVQNVPVAFVLNGSSFTHNCQSGVELVEFLKGIFPGVYFAGIKEGCLMAIFVFDLLLALQLPILLHSHLPRLTDLTVTEVYISDLVRISVCSGKITFLGSGEELTELFVVYEEKLAVEKDPVLTDTLRSARNIVSKRCVELSEQSLPHSEMPGGPLAPLRMFLTRLKEYLPSWEFLSRFWVSHRSQEPYMVKPSVLDEPLQEPSHAPLDKPLDKPLDEQMGKESMVESIMAKTTIGSMMIKPCSMGNTSQIPLGTPSRHLKEASHPQKDNTIGIAVVVNYRRSKDTGMKWKETLEKVKLDVRMIEDVSKFEMYKYTRDLSGHKMDPNSYFVFVFIVDDAEEFIGYGDPWLGGKYRTLVFFDASKPSFDPRFILYRIFEDCQNPLIVAFCSGKSPEFVRERISKNGGLGELVEIFGVEWSSYAPRYPRSRPKLIIWYRGKVDHWDLSKDARRLEFKEEVSEKYKEEVSEKYKEEVSEKYKEEVSEKYKEEVSEKYKEEVSEKLEGMMLIESGRQESGYAVEASHPQKDNTIGIAVVVNNRRSKDACIKWKETLEKVKLDVRMIEDDSKSRIRRYTRNLCGHTMDPNSYFVFVFIVDDAEEFVGYTDPWLGGKCRTLVFFDTSEPSFNPRFILYCIFEDCQNPLIVAFCSGKSPEFVRESISKDGGLGELVEIFGVEWSSYAPRYPRSRPKLIIWYRGKVDNWDLSKDARRFESKEEVFKKWEGMMPIESGRQESNYTTSVEASHPQKDNTIGTAVVFNNRRSEDAGLKWKETLEKVKFDVRMIEDASEIEIRKYTRDLPGHKMDPNSYLVFVLVGDDAEEFIGYTGPLLEGKCRTLFFFDTSEPPFYPPMILNRIYAGRQSPLIVAFSSGRSAGFVRDRISKNGGLGELVKFFGVEWSSYAPRYPSSRPELYICYRGEVDNWDLFEDARRLELKEEVPKKPKMKVPKTSKEEVLKTSEWMKPKTFEGKTTRTQSPKLTTPQDHKDTVS